jgi:hypothetical protein
MARRFLTAGELAERWNIAVGTLHYWRNAAPPRGPVFYKIENAVRYDVDDVEAYEKAQRVETAA